MITDKLNTRTLANVGIIAATMNNGETMEAVGKYTATCWEPQSEFKAQYDALFQKHMWAIEHGEKTYAEVLKNELDAIPMQKVWEDSFDNLVTTVGKNALLDNGLTGSGFTQVGPYMGLISSISYTAIAAGDTMASHAGWTEAGSTNAPTFAARGTPAWSAASAGSKATSSAVSFTMTGAGTLKGCFIVGYTGATNVLMATTGTLFSAGLFTGGDQVVSNGNVVTVSYTLSV